MDGSLVFLGGGAIAILSIVLGFIALVKQKTYIDKETQKPTEIEVPILGKMKSNYPSLVFVFLGFAFAFYTVEKAQIIGEAEWIEKDIWHIEGRFISDEPNQKWTSDYLSFNPKRIVPAMNAETGRYSVSLEIPRGQTFEDAYELIGYTDRELSATIITKPALNDFNAGGNKYIEVSGDFYRKYHPVKIKKP